MSDRRRKGSLGWYHNSSRGTRSLIPVHTLSPHMYFIKGGMDSLIVEDVLTPVTYLKRVPHVKLNDRQWKIEFSKVSSNLVRRKDVIREISTTASTSSELESLLLEVPKLDLIGLSKGRGTLGPVARRHVKMQKRKAARSGVTRKPGSMGLRIPGRVPYTKPFSGKTGFSRRTIFGVRNLGFTDSEERDHLKTGALLVKGSVMGPIGRVVCVRPSVRR